MSLIYNVYKAKVMRGEHILHSQVIKVMLVTSAYVANPDDDFASTPAAFEVVGTGYTGGFGGSGRKTFTTKVTAVDDANNRGYFDADDLVWIGVNGFTVAAMVFYKEGTSDADSDLIAYVDSGGFPKIANGSDLTVQWSASPLGIIQAT